MFSFFFLPKNLTALVWLCSSATARVQLHWTGRVAKSYCCDLPREGSTSEKARLLLGRSFSKSGLFREVLHGVGADGVGVKFPIFAVNRCKNALVL